MELNCFREHEKKENFESLGTVSKSKLFECNGKDLQMSYFIGVDWIVTDKEAIYVEPKINEGSKQTNYLQMLFSALKHIDVGHTKELFEINFDAPSIEIEQKQDLLTPLLVVQFLGIVRKIVKKGLKKSYYKVEKNLTAKTKGKILVNQTIKKNIVKNDVLKTYCSYEEFGFNGLENRLLKKTLFFVQRYLSTIPHIDKTIRSLSILLTIFCLLLKLFQAK